MLKKFKQIILDYSSPQNYYLQNSIKDFSKTCGSVCRLIDVGSGRSPFIGKFCFEIKILVDIEKRGSVDMLSDVQALAIKDNHADLVLLTEVLEHVPDENKALKEISRILSLGGWFILSVPFLFGIHESVDYRRWTAQGIQKLLEDHGFKIIDFQTRGGFFSTVLCIWRNMPRELLGGNFRSAMAKILSPLIALNFILCLILTPLAILLDQLDKKKLSSTGYIVLCQKPAK